MKISLAILAVCLTQTASAQRSFVTEQQSVERVIGLLDLPDVMEESVRKGCDDATTTQGSAGAPFYTEPSKVGPAAGHIYMRQYPELGCTLLVRASGSSRDEELPTQESDYEILAAVVYERRGLWFRIALPRGSAWIERTHDNDFLPYPQLLTKKMAYIADGWDGRLRKTAGVKGAIEGLPAEWKKEIPKGIGVDVLSVRRLGSDDWLYVRFDNERCGDSLKGLKPVEGWLPAYRPDGQHAVWFHSRGC